MKLFVKNMVCNRCKMVVRSELEKLGLNPIAVDLGEIEVADATSKKKIRQVDDALRKVGFEIMDDRKSRVIEKVKNLLIDLVRNHNSALRINLSNYLATELRLDYTYLTNLFTQVEGTTIEQYFIAQKIERVKELLVYNETTLSQIAYQLNYSSVAHLSRQFKKVTGLTPSHYKQLGINKRKSLEDL